MIERRFVDWNEPVLPAVARALADEHTSEPLPSGSELRLDGLVLTFPGRRPARRMTELLVEEAERRGAVLTPPRMVTVGSLPELLYRPERPLADGPLSRRAWARALRDTPADELRTVFAHLPGSADLPGWMTLGGLLQRLHRQVGAEGWSFGEVAETCRRAGLDFDDSARWRVLSGVQERYLDFLRDLNRANRDRARSRALETDAVALRGSDAGLREAPSDRDPDPDAPPEAVHLIGVVEMPGVLKEMLERVAGSGTPVVPWVHAPEGRSGDFDALGCVVPEAWSDARVPVDDDVLAFRDRPADQASEAVRTLARWGERLAPDEVTVGVPDEALVSWLEQRFTSYDVPHRDAAGTPLDRTGPYRLLQAAARYLDGRRFVDLAALVRHPDVERRLAAGPLETADAYFADHLPASAPELDGRPASRSPGRAMGEMIRELEGDELLGPLGGDERPPGEWMPVVLRLLERAYGGRPLRRGSPADRPVIEACERIREAARALHRMPSEVEEPCDAAAALRLLLSELQAGDARIPPEPERAAVEMLGWLELHLDDAPALVLTGANEPHVPESVGADAFLPNRLRSALGIPDDDRRYARDAYLMTAILRARDQVRIVAGCSDGRGEPLRPSRLLLTGPGQEPARRLLRFLRGGDGPAPAPVAPLGVEPAAESHFRAPPEPAIPLPRAPERFSVTEFRSLLADPYRWALERHLDLEEVHDGDRELDPLRFGSLAHRVLDRFGRSDAVHATDPEVVSRELEARLDRLARRRFGDSLPAVRVQLEQLRARLRAFARWHAAWIGSGWRVVATEAGPGREGVPFDVDGEPVRLVGRIDRIDVHEETGRVAVLDYKTGDSATDPAKAHRARDGEWRDLQLPLYRHMLPHVTDAEGKPVAAGGAVRLGYVCLPKETEEVGAAFLDWPDDVLLEADEEARRLIRWLRECGEIRFDPARVSSSRWDPLASLLGRGTLVSGGSELDDESRGDRGELDDRDHRNDRDHRANRANRDDRDDRDDGDDRDDRDAGRARRGTEE